MFFNANLAGDDGKAKNHQQPNAARVIGNSDGSMAKENSQFRVRHIESGKFLGSRVWGETYSNNGKFYRTAGHAKSAIKGSGIPSKGHELVEYVLVEKSATPL